MAGEEFDPIIDAAAQHFDLDPALIKAQLATESNFNPDAVGPKIPGTDERAIGIAQFMPKTAASLGIDPTKPDDAIFGLAALQRQNLDRYKGDVEKAVMAYHGGTDPANWGDKTKAYLGKVSDAFQALKQAVIPSADAAELPPNLQARPDQAPAAAPANAPDPIEAALAPTSAQPKGAAATAPDTAGDVVGATATYDAGDGKGPITGTIIGVHPSGNGYYVRAPGHTDRNFVGKALITSMSPAPSAAQQDAQPEQPQADPIEAALTAQPQQQTPQNAAPTGATAPTPAAAVPFVPPAGSPASTVGAPGITSFNPLGDVSAETRASKLGRLLQGARDPFDAAAQLLPRGLAFATSLGGVAPNPVSDFFQNQAQGVDRINQQNEQDYQAARRAPQGLSDLVTGPQDPGFDAMRLVGNVVSPANLAMARLLTAAAPVANAIPGVARVAATLPGRIAGAAGRGAAYAALIPANDPTRSFVDQKLGQLEGGAIAGPLAEGASSVVARLIRPATSAPVQALVDRGVNPTIGQTVGGMPAVIEEKLTSIPFAGDLIRNAQRRGVQDFNRAIYNEALAPLGERHAGPLGHEGVAQVESRLSAAYDRLLPQMTFRADPQFVADIANLRSLAANMPPEQAARFEQILQRTVAPRLAPNATMDGLTLKGLESELGQLARGYLGDSSFDNRELGSAINEVLASIRDGLVRSNPQQAGELSAINRGWAIFTRIRDAASRLGSANGIFTPAQLLAAVRAGDRSVGKGAFARGDALLQDLATAGKDVLGTKYPDSGSAGRYFLGALLGHGLGLPPEVLPAMAGAALPYTGPGQRIAAALLARRPQAAEPIAQAVRRYGGAALVPGAASLAATIQAGQNPRP